MILATHPWPSSSILGAARVAEHDEAGRRTSLDDREAVRRVRAGDREAFRHLVDRYHRPLHALLGGALPDPGTVDDLVQQAFVQAYRHLGRFDPSRPFLPWITAIARNLLVDHLRRRRRRDSRLDEYRLHLLRLGDEGGGDEVLDRRRRALASCLEELPDDGREALRLRYRDDRDLGEIGAAIGRTPGATQRFLSRLRRRLRECIERRIPAGA